jgi:small-conductance mechanosensitive channel
MLRRLAAVAVCVGIVGCGGSDKPSAPTTARTTTSATSPQAVSHYRAQVTSVTNQFARAGEQLRDSVGGAQATPQQAAAALTTFQGSVRAAADALSRLRPPPAAAAAQRQLAAAFRAIAAACQPSIDAGRAGDDAHFSAARKRLQAQLNGALGARARAAATRIDAGLAGG